MIVAIASGKGGTGKTLVATGLARVAMDLGYQGVSYVDCDVEEPNGHLFLHPALTSSVEVSVPIPEIDHALCTYCGRCAQVCAFHALAVIRDQVMVFSELCHGCGLCASQCPEGAIREVDRHLGTIEFGHVNGMEFAQGTLDVGQAMATPVIRELKRLAVPAAHDGRLILLDAPPGNACPVVETVRGADVALLVTEPTPFGLHDLKIATEVARDALGVPVAVVINRADRGDQGVEEFCLQEGIPVVLRIPLDRRIAETYSEGNLWVDSLPEYRPGLKDLADQLTTVARGTG